jgi:hypothetical protein
MTNNIVFAKLDILTLHGVTSIWSSGFYTSPFTFVEVPAGSKSTLGVAFLALRGFPPFEVCKKGLVFAL